MESQEYNRLVNETFERIERAFDEVDPDVVEADRVAGTIQVIFGDGTKFIVSTQSAVHQIWLAGAARGWHFSYDSEAEQWVALKNGDELYQAMGAIVSEQLGESFTL